MGTPSMRRTSRPRSRTFDSWVSNTDEQRKRPVYSLALTVLAQLVFYVKGYFVVDGWFGFGAVYGFFCCLVMVLFAKALGYLLKRPNDYYAERDDDA